ncbi:MAG: cation:dicarboxylase symporter family transporter, partial [Agathobacter sp.]|nr:cation:dicarboxylase symporter family transporter [Agathobacter sp.]
MKLLVKGMKSPAALAVGIVAGFLTAFYGKSAVPYLKVVSTIYISLLQMCVLPIVSCAVAVNIGALFKGKSKKLLGRWIMAVAVTLVLSAGIAVAFTFAARNLIAPDEQTKLVLAGLQEAESPEDSFFTEVSYYNEPEPEPEQETGYSVMNFFVNAIPTNIFTAFTENNTLKVLLFFALFGIMLGFIDEQKASAVLKGMDGIYQTFCRLIDAILIFLPLGLCAMIAVQFSQEGISGIVVSLFLLILLIYVILLAIILLSFAVVHRSVGCTLREHMRAIKRTFFVAVGTGSCIATVSVAMDDIPDHFHLDKGMVRSIMPVGITIFQSGVIACAAVAAMFGSVLYNVELGAYTVAVILVGSIMYSFSIVGIPGIVAVSMLGMLLSPVGVPSEIIVLLYLAIIPVIDPLSVFASVYSNIAITAVVAAERKKRARKLGKKLFLAMLGISVAAVLVVSAASLFQFLEAKKLIIRTKEEENTELYETNVGILTDSTRESLGVLAVSYAQEVSGNMKTIEDSVRLTAMDIADLYDGGGESASRFPDSCVYLQPGVSWEAVEAEFLQVKGVRDLIDNAANTYRDVSAIYYVSESGMLLSNIEVDYSAGEDQIDRRTRDWYTGALEAGGIYWTEIYQDALSGQQALTCSCPVRDRGGTVRGVVAQDIYLDSICNAIFTNSSDLFVYSFIADEQGERIAENGTAGALEIDGEVQAIISSGEDNSVKIYPDQQVILGHAKIPVNGWSFFALMDYDTITKPANLVGESIARSNDQFLSFLDGRIRWVCLAFLFVAAIVISLVFFVASRLARSIVRPVEELTKGVEKISTGNLDYRLTVQSEGEIGALAAAFQKMTVDLRDYIDHLAHVTAEKERIGAELDIARNIQKSMLPCSFPAFPDRKEFDVYATMEPAKEVGGDFYDFFMVDDEHLAIVIADVSGKGVPAALFMVIGKTLIKDHTQPGRDLGEVFSEVNNLLCESNSEGLFITAFEGVLHLATGEFRYVNAGHEIPFFCKKGGRFEEFPVKAGFVLAGMEDMKYSCGMLTMNPGDQIFQYTDGVTEATNCDNELYGMERLGSILAASSGLSPEGLLPRVKADIEAFVDGAPQFDDITMLCLEYKGK